MSRKVKTIYTCFPEGKHKVLTMSYDDGKAADRRLVEIFNKNGIKGTFHLNSGIMEEDPERIPLNEVKELYKGHEVSCHTYTHPTICLLYTSGHNKRNNKKKCGKNFFQFNLPFINFL